LSSIGAKRQSITRREAPDIELAVSSSGVLKFAAAIMINNIEAQTEGGGSSSIGTGHSSSDSSQNHAAESVFPDSRQT
jgi:hypothetical protein